MMASLGPADPERLGAYDLLGRIGSGAQGSVYLGRAPQGRTVAIKLMHAELTDDAVARARFVRELELLRRVAGFCTAQVLGADVVGARPYIVSEYVPGPSLRALVRERGPRVGGDLDRLAVGTATALAAIHRAGIVHRDLKPHNVLVGPDGPRVIDFGVARALDARTTAGPLVGTVAYMAPEQFDGGVAGPATDLFSWASTLLFAATGRDAFAGGELPAVMYRIQHADPDLSALPARVADIAEACLTKDPRDRPDAETVLLWLLGATSPRRTPGPDDAGPPRPVPVPRKADSAIGAAETTPPVRSPDPGAMTMPLDVERNPSENVADPAGRVTAEAVARRPTVPVHASPDRTETGRSARPLPVGRGVRAALTVSGLLAVADMAGLAAVVGDPRLTAPPLLAVGGTFCALAVITLVAVVLAWRGGRAAAWTVVSVRATRVALWALWAGITVEPAVLVVHAVLTAGVVALLVRGLCR